MSEIERRVIPGEAVTALTEQANVLNGHVRASNPLKDRYEKRLQEAVVAGCLTSEEYEARIHLLLAAKTEHDLQALERDLPNLRLHQHGDPPFRRFRKWLDGPRTHRHAFHISAGIFLALWGIIIPMVCHRLLSGLLSDTLTASFVTTGIVGFLANAVFYIVWMDQGGL